MANVAGVRAVGESIARFLESSYPESLKADYGGSFQVVSSAELASDPEFESVVSLYLYRITVSEHLRNALPPGRRDRGVPLALNLHYLMSVWANSADAEQTILAWAMRTLHDHPTLDATRLLPDAGWGRDEVIHVAPAELTNEDLMRIWDALTPSYRLSYSYVARVVVVDSAHEQEHLPVVATRVHYQAMPDLGIAPPEGGA